MKVRNRLAEFLRQSKIEGAQRSALDQDQLSSFEILPCLYHGKESKRVILAIPTKGCSLFRRPQGGCLHCGLFNDGIINDKPDNQDLINKLAKNLKRLDFARCPVLCIYVPGSFLDNEEINEVTRHELISLVAQQEDIKKVIFESLPQFITAQKIRNLKSVLVNKEIEIAIGLDSCNDQVRDVCINKSFTLKTFAKACTLLKQHEIQFSAFALLKPPFLTEQESISDTIRTAQYLFTMGAAAVSIEPNTVQENTFTWRLFSKNLYRPPWLWSIIEVIKQLPSGFEIRIGGIVVYPKAVQSAHNCCMCTSTIGQKIQQFNLIQDRNIFADLDCACKNQWQEELRTVNPPLFERIASILQEFAELD